MTNESPAQESESQVPAPIAPETLTAIPVNEPRAGMPDVIETNVALAEACASLAAGTGPVALDAERASGFKYSQRAYLIQLKREGSGLFLIDPLCFDDLSPVHTALQGVDWIVHAASQDLVCLAEAGLTPTAALFDTELAGRLLGYPRVGLGTLVESILGYSLAKEHSAADWSTRPIPESWLRYAALDVEFLIELWTEIEQQLRDTDKFDIAVQEFDHVKMNTLPIERNDPWRRTSGLHKVRKPHDLAFVRELWNARDALARDLDTAPGRLLSDSYLLPLAIEAAESEPGAPIAGLNQRATRRHQRVWRDAIARAKEMPQSQWPAAKVTSDSPPPVRAWIDRAPESWAALEYAKTAIQQVAEQMNIPQENIVTPESVRRVLWNPPSSPDDLTRALIALKVRPWQHEIVKPILVTALWNRPALVEKPTSQEGNGTVTDRDKTDPDGI